jgi:hypothetical protein
LLLELVRPHGVLKLSFQLNEIDLSVIVELLEGEHGGFKGEVTVVGSLLNVVEELIK